MNRLGLNSKNSSKPPSMDPNRKNEFGRHGKRKPGGQNGHEFSTLQPVSDPDRTEIIKVDISGLPKDDYHFVGYEPRQVIDTDISRFVTEWLAEILEDSKGRRYTAPFPEGVTRPVQYGICVKVNEVYMSQYQLIPYNRIEDHFDDQMQIPVSAGTIHNFNKDVFDRLDFFDEWVRNKLADSELVNLDETGVNIEGKRRWLHNVSNDRFTYLYPHEKRGSEAMDKIGIMPCYTGVTCHDHWKPYYKYGCIHALCNARHFRELERSLEQDMQQWALKISELLKETNRVVIDAGGCLEPEVSMNYRKRYREILHEAEE